MLEYIQMEDWFKCFCGIVLFMSFKAYLIAFCARAFPSGVEINFHRVYWHALFLCHFLYLRLFISDHNKKKYDNNSFRILKIITR